MSDYLKEGFIDEVKGCLGGRGSGQENVIETIKVNGVGQTVDENKAVNIPVPTKTSDLDNDSGYQTNSEVSSTVAAEVAKIVADAPEDFDTLKEMSDWISQHEDSAAAMNSAILKNKEDISSLYTSKSDVSDVQTVETSVDELNSNLDGLEFGEVAGGKNVLNYGDLVSGDYEFTNKSIRVTVDFDKRLFVKAGTSVAFSFTPTSKINRIWLVVVDANNTILEELVIGGIANTVVITTKDGYLTPIWGYINDDLTWGECTVNDVIDCKPQIEFNNVVTEYEPYIPSVKMLAEEVSNQNESLSVIGKCKNLLNSTLGTTTQNGITCTANGDGTYTFNGTATAKTDFDLMSFDNLEVGKKYKLVGCPSGGSESSYRLMIQKTITWDNNMEDIGNGGIIKTLYNKTFDCWIRIAQGTTVNNLVFKPMLTTNLNATYDDFVPYTGDRETLTADVAELKNDLIWQDDKWSVLQNCTIDDDYSMLCGDMFFVCITFTTTKEISNWSFSPIWINKSLISKPNVGYPILIQGNSSAKAFVKQYSTGVSLVVDNLPIGTYTICGAFPIK